MGKSSSVSEYHQGVVRFQVILIGKTWVDIVRSEDRCKLNGEYLIAQEKKTLGVDLELNLSPAYGTIMAFYDLRIVEDEAALKCVNSIKMGWMRRRDNERSRVGVNRLIDTICDVESGQH